MDINWCYGLHPVLWHAMGTLHIASGVHQGVGNPLGPLFFFSCAKQVDLHNFYDDHCKDLINYCWCLDDGTLTGPKVYSSGFNTLNLFTSLGPHHQYAQP